LIDAALGATFDAGFAATLGFFARTGLEALLEEVEEREERGEDDEDAVFSLTSTNALMPKVLFRLEYHSLRNCITNSTSTFLP
jgi:hypothetical protein